MKPSLDWLLVFVPITLALRYTQPEAQTWIFLSACLAILPLAGWLGHATEHLAAHTGEGLGGLLNATFGNAAELIIALAALQKGMHDVVKASLTGSIIGNVLLVLGASITAGGIKFKSQQFQPVAARSQATMLTLAAIALVMPAAFHHMVQGPARIRENDLSLAISVVLLATYALSLLFTLHTHKQLFGGEGGAEAEWSMGKAIGVLAFVTVLIAWMSEILVGSVEHAAHSIGMTSAFVGVIVVATIGNAAEHTTAIMAARKNRMDLSLGIAVGSSVQIAVFVAPLLVLASYFIGPAPMNLVFTPPEVLAVALAVIISGQICGDGESNWMEGVQLLAVYMILAMVFYFLPEVVHAP